MSVFEFECQCGHVTDFLVPLAERPKEIPCEVCGEPARYIISAAKTTFHANDRKSIKGHTVNKGGIRT
jgi:predicted nucleic acid-binding Zn ribbon protein